MPWVRLDDLFHSNPKILRVGNEGAGLYVRALSYCGNYLTDGFVPGPWVKTIATAKLSKSLTAAGLWQEVDGGYQIPDYLDLNPSREDVAENRKKKAEAGRRGAESRWRGDSKGMASAIADATPLAPPTHGEGSWQNDAPSPVPSPLPITAKGSRPNGIDDDRWRELERILRCVTDADSSTPSVLAVYARQLPIGMVAKVRESAEANRKRVGSGWVVNALKDEIRTREAA